MNELTGWCFVRVFQSPSFRLPSSRLCGVCSCLVVQKDVVEAQESAPPPPADPVHLVVCNNDNNNKKACKSVVEFA